MNMIQGMNLLKSLVARRYYLCIFFLGGEGGDQGYQVYFPQVINTHVLQVLEQFRAILAHLLSH